MCDAKIYLQTRQTPHLGCMASILTTFILFIVYSLITEQHFIISFNYQADQTRKNKLDSQAVAKKRKLAPVLVYFFMWQRSNLAGAER